MFLSQIKKGLGLLSMIVILGSCSKYQQLLKNKDLSVKYKAAEDYYKAGEYKKALGLFEIIVPSYRGKPQAERVVFYEADCYYQLEDYYIAGYKMGRFNVSYPKSDKAEEALFKGAHSLYELSPPYTLDQKETYEGIDKLQNFINNYPESEYINKANEYAAVLQKKIEKKYYKIAKQYHHRNLYKAAIKAFDNYLLEYPGSEYTEQALYYRLESAHTLAINSFKELVPERLKVAKEYNEAYFKRGKDENLKKKAQEISEDINKRLQDVAVN